MLVILLLKMGGNDRDKVSFSGLHMALSPRGCLSKESTTHLLFRLKRSLNVFLRKIVKKTQPNKQAYKNP